MIKSIAKQVLPPIIYSAMRFIYSAIRGAVCKNNSKNQYSPNWYIIKNGILKGREFFIDPRSVYIDGNYDQFYFDYLNKLNLQGELVGIKGATVWDVGAHIGYYSLSLASLVGPSGHVVAFEPNPHNIDRLRKQIERNEDLGERITLMTCALGNMDGEESFVFSPDVDNGLSSGSHLKQAFAPEEPQVYQSFSETKVPVVMADTLLRDKRVPAPSIIKIDVEGAESFVLAGAQHLIGSLRPVLLVEMHHITAMHDTINILLRLGYHTRIVVGAPNSSSRCYVVANPEDNHSLKGVPTGRDAAQ